eukprot:3793-Ditylum_brightwellii.AAC.1
MANMTTTTDATTISAAYLKEVADAPIVIATSSIASGKQDFFSSQQNCLLLLFGQKEPSTYIVKSHVIPLQTTIN